MRQLYSFKDGLIYQHKLKKILFIIIVLGLVITSTIVTITITSPTTLVMFIDIILTSIFLSLLYIYFFFYRPYYRAAYQFLAKIQHYPLQEQKGKITNIGEEALTLFNKAVIELTLDNGHKLFIEEKFKSLLKVDQCYHFQLLQNVMISFDEEQDFE